MTKVKLDMEQVADVVAKVLCDKFVSIKIIDVKASRDLNRDGDDILQITIVFDGKLKSADAKLVAGAARHIRPELHKINADLFPLVSFVSKLDYRNRNKLEAN